MGVYFNFKNEFFHIYKVQCDFGGDFHSLIVNTFASRGRISNQDFCTLVNRHIPCPYSSLLKMFSFFILIHSLFSIIIPVIPRHCHPQLKQKSFRILRPCRFPQGLMPASYSSQCSVLLDTFIKQICIPHPRERSAVCQPIQKNNQTLIASPRKR